MKILIAYNPLSGQGDAGLSEYVRELVRRGCDVTLRPMSPERGLERALVDAEDHDRVVAAGGDGTVAAAAYLLRNTGIPLVPYPAGTANLIALNLREPSDPVRLAETTLDGALMRTDLGEIIYDATPESTARERRRLPRPRAHKRVGFTGIAGVGADAALIDGAQKLKSIFGAGAYLVALLQNPQPAIARIDLDLDGRRVQTEGTAVLFVNFARIQFDLSITHDSDATDGQLEVVVVRARNVTELIPAVMAAMLDRVVSHPDRSQMFDTYRASKVHVSAQPALPLQTDGETLSATTPLTARVLPLASTFVVPRD